MSHRPAPLFAHLLGALALAGGLFGGLFGEPAPSREDVAGALRPRVAALPLGDDTRTLYAAARYQPRWETTEAQVALYRALAGAPEEGLPPALVHAGRLAYLAGRLAALNDAPVPDDGPDPRAAVLAEADLLLTDGLLRYADALLGRRVVPDSLYPDQWHAAPRADTALVLLHRAVRAGDADAALDALDALRPRHPEYAALRRALARLRAAEPYWAPIPDGAPLHVGERSIRVPHLRGRLAALGYLAADVNGWAAPEPFRFDSLLAGALARFQADGELPADSVLTPEVTRRLNRDHAEVVAAVEMNLERWRWLPDHLGDFHVLANLPAYELTVRNVAARGGWRDTLRMPAAIGLADAGSWTTPVLSDSITTVVFDPTWYVPSSIAAASLLPMARADSTALTRQGFRVYRGGAPVDPRLVPWDSVSVDEFSFVQRPGRGNPLGRLKFVMPNAHAVLIHDTNKPGHFARADRAVSTGCVQASDAPALARLLLGVVNRWPAGEVDAWMARWGERAVPLARPVPVHFVYFTAWPEADGRLRLYDDVYGHDAVLAAALGLPFGTAGDQAAEAG
ncbi:MAG TPA: L,D-transpeptidase family protein [Rubricoccaceae bacterium]|nr:L,D-transpeptidase family protein [Rubricoccaceae bacterium]